MLQRQSFSSSQAIKTSDCNDVRSTEDRNPFQLSGNDINSVYAKSAIVDWASVKRALRGHSSVADYYLCGFGHITSAFFLRAVASSIPSGPTPVAFSPSPATGSPTSDNNGQHPARHQAVNPNRTLEQFNFFQTDPNRTLHTISIGMMLTQWTLEEDPKNSPTEA